MSSRTVVFWVGGAPPEVLRRELRQRDLKVRYGTARGALELCHTPDSPLQAVLVSYHDSLRDTLNMLYTEVLHSGSHIEVVVSSPDTYDADLQHASDALIGFVGVVQTDGRDDRAYAVAERCARHNAGRTANFDLQIDGDEISDTGDPGRRILFQRAFSDFAKIHVTRLPPGRSGADVFLVRPTDSDGYCAQPFVVKVARKALITSEIALNESVISFVPFRNRAPHVVSRCVSGPKEALLTSLLVERAERLDLHLKSHEPDLAIAAIFAGPLRNWRDDVIEQEVDLGRQYRDKGILPGSGEALIEAYEGAVRTQSDALTPSQLLERISAIGSRSVQTCYSHGDLHTRNVFVTYGGTDVILIDFAHASIRPQGKEERLHAALDLAVLDVSLALDGDDKDLASLDVTRGLYEPPLLAPRPRQRNALSGAAANRFRAIQDLRSHARGCCGGSDYDIGVACALLRLAKTPPSVAVAAEAVSLERRVLAYNAANNLIAYATSN